MNPLRFLCLAVIAALALAPLHAETARPSILMIAVDDLRPQLGCYGDSYVKSPHIDRFAASSVLFNRAYCMVPTCGASRASLFTSIRPSPKRFVSHLAWAEKEAPGVVALHTHLKAHGYTTISNGKILHHPTDSAAGWSEPAWRPQSGRGSSKGQGERRGPPFEVSDRPDEEQADGMIAKKTIEDLRKLKEAGKPFFLASGFLKPHLPFVAPKKYYDLYPPESVPAPKDYFRPKDAPAAAIHNSGELRNYEGVPPKGKVSDEMARGLIRGYHACVSFTDAQIGAVLAELDELDLAKSTIVVLWSDHGWNLGEHTLWNKHSCFETSMRVPFIVRAPGIAGGVKTDGLTELIDLYPTLCDLAGLPIPKHVQGRSLVPLLKDPAMKWSEQAIGRFGPGDTIRTDTHRFTEYTGRATGRMLYDHRTDPGENMNVSELPASAGTLEKLTARLRAGKGKDSDVRGRQ
jgi:arylsulfatase A-like enzyme